MKEKHAYTSSAPEVALSLWDKFVRDSTRCCLLLKTLPKDEGSFGTFLRGHPFHAPGLRRSSLRRLSSNFQCFDGRLISKIYELLASSQSRVKDAVRSNGA